MGHSERSEKLFFACLTQVGGAIFSFASVLLITRYLGSEGYGAIIALIAASQIAQMLVNWSSLAVSRFGTEEFPVFPRFYRKTRFR